MKHPMYGSEGSISADIADVAAATAQANDSDLTEILVDVADIRTKLNAVIAALAKFGAIDDGS